MDNPTDSLLSNKNIDHNKISQEKDLDSFNNQNLDNYDNKSINEHLSRKHQPMMHPNLYFAITQVTKEKPLPFREAVRLNDIGRAEDIKKILEKSDYSNVVKNLRLIGIETTDSKKYEAKNFDKTTGIYAANKPLVDFLLSDYPKPQTNSLYLYGASGIGKSHLFKIYANRLLFNGERVRLFKFESMMTELISKQRTQTSLNEFYAMMKTYKETDFLLIDNFNSDVAALRHVSILSELIEHRMQRGKKTYFTSDVHPDGLEEKIGKTLVNTILDACSVRYLKGNFDYRRQKAI